MTILITSVGSNTAISVVKALRKDATKYNIVGTDSNPKHLCAGAKLVDRFYSIAPAFSREEYLRELVRIVKDDGVRCLIPIHDLEVEVVSQALDILGTMTFVACNSPNVVLLCNNKVTAGQAARKAGITVPAEYDRDFSGTFPLIAKPINGVSSDGIRVVRTYEQMKEFLLENQRGRFVIQEFIEGIEYTVDTYSDYLGHFYGGLVRQRIETKAGISTKGVTVRNNDLISICKKFLESIKYKGASNIQFIVRNEIPYFIEINPRFSGGGILSYEAGFNSPALTMKEALGMKLPVFNSSDLSYGLFMTRYWQESFYQNKQ